MPVFDHLRYCTLRSCLGPLLFALGRKAASKNVEVDGQGSVPFMDMISAPADSSAKSATPVLSLSLNQS